MTRAAVIEAIRDRWLTLETANSLDVLHDNEPGGAPLASRHEFSVQINSEQQVHAGDVGGRRFRIIGQAIATLRTQAAKGDDVLIELSDTITTAFLNVVDTDPIIYFGRPMLTGRPTRIDGGFVRVLTIPFEADVFG